MSDVRGGKRYIAREHLDGGPASQPMAARAAKSASIPAAAGRSWVWGGAHRRCAQATGQDSECEVEARHLV